MKTKQCEVIQDLLPLYIDNICSDESRRMVSEHLESCDECKKLYENMSKPVEQDLSEPELDSKQAFKAIKHKWYWKAGLIALYFLPVIVALVLYATLVVVARIGFINLEVGICFAMLVVAAILMTKNKWWGCLFGVAIGVLFIEMSTQYTGQAIDIERPLGIILCTYYAACGFLSYRQRGRKKFKN